MSGKVLKGLLIDPEKREISEVEIPVGEDGSCLNGMYRAIGCSAVDVGRGGLRYLPNHPEDDVWFDDEGLFSDCKYSFKLPGWVPLIGRGLILGFNDEGDSVDHTLKPKDVQVLRLTIMWGRQIPES